MSDKPRIKATFRPQAWINDYATDTGENVQFDITEKFLSLSLQKIKDFKFNNYDSDYMADDLPERQAHNGPFEVDMEMAVETFFEAHGIPEWRNLTEEQLVLLRETYGVEVNTVKERLEYLRGEILAERISYAEIAELQGLADEIDKDDVLLLEWAGVEEGGN